MFVMTLRYLYWSNSSGVYRCSLNPTVDCRDNSEAIYSGDIVDFVLDKPNRAVYLIDSSSFSVFNLSTNTVSVREGLLSRRGGGDLSAFGPNFTPCKMLLIYNIFIDYNNYCVLIFNFELNPIPLYTCVHMYMYVCTCSKCLHVLFWWYLMCCINSSQKCVFNTRKPQMWSCSVCSVCMQLTEPLMTIHSVYSQYDDSSFCCYRHITMIYQQFCNV